MTDIDGRCGSCAAFTRSRVDPERGRVGECALEVFPPPVSAGSTCSRYRPKGASAPAPRPRAAGEPRRSGTPRPVASAALLPEFPRALAPSFEEIDIDMDIDAPAASCVIVLLAEELGISTLHRPRWQGGELVLFPEKQGTQERRASPDAFFHKIVMIRDKLRVLEQRSNTTR
ncbi:MAG: hypothetical protein R3F14_23475 [Polyangiaceae bacterium]